MAVWISTSARLTVDMTRDTLPLSGGTEDPEESAERVRAFGGEGANGPRHRSRSGRGRTRAAPGRASRGRAPGRRRASGVDDAASAARSGSPGTHPLTTLKVLLEELAQDRADR